MSIKNRVFASKQEQGTLRVASIRYFFEPERIAQPVEVSLQKVSYTKFRANKVADDKLHARGAFAVEEIVAHIAFPRAKCDGINEAGT